MNDKDTKQQIQELNIEDFISIVFIVLGILNIYGDYLLKQSIKKHDNKSQENATNIFIIALIITFFIHLFYFDKHYKNYKKVNSNKKKLFIVKVLGSSFFLAGVICSLYFIIKNKASNDNVPEI